MAPTVARAAQNRARDLPVGGGGSLGAAAELRTARIDNKLPRIR
jgi:hypothetical protein